MRRRSDAGVGLAAGRLALALAVLGLTGHADAAQVLTNGTFQTGTTGWTTATSVGSPAFNWDASGAANGGSAKTSQTGTRITFGGYYTQTTPSIAAGSTVTLSFSYRKTWANATPNSQAADVTIVRPDNSTVSVWSDATVAQMAGFSSVAAFDVSAQFTQTGTYQIRLGLSGRSGNASTATVEGWFDEVVLDVTAPAGATTTLGDGVAGTGAAVCPGASGQKLDGFSFVNSAGTNPVTALTVTTTNQAAIASMQIWNEAGTTQYFTTVNNPGSNTWSFSGGTSIPVGTTPANFNVLVTYRDQATAPAGNTTTTASVTAFTTANGKAGTDAADTTLTLDNSAANPAAWATQTAGDASVTLGWTLGTAGDSVVVVRYTANTDTTMAADGASYAPGDPFGTGGTVRYVGTATGFTDNAGLSNGTTYYYRIFDYDGCQNCAATAPWTTGLTPNAAVAPVTPGLPTATVDSCSQITVRAPFTGDSNANSSTAFRRGPSASGPWTDACSNVGGASPRACVDGVSGAATYYYQVEFSDIDGVTGSNPQMIGPFTTPSCVPNDTTAGTASAAAAGCSQINVTAPFTGDGNGNGTVAVEYNTTNTWPGTAACTVSGASPRACLIPGLAASTAYYVRVSYADPDGVSGTAVQVLPGTYATTACSGNGAPPMILFLSPAKNAIVGGTDTFRVQVYDPDGVATASVGWGVDGASPTAAVALNANYNCNMGTQTQCRVFEFAVDTVALALANGSHFVTVRAQDSAAAPSASLRSWPFRVNNTGSKAGGSGTLLRRTHASQMCLDCHNLGTHSSQATSFKYGSWTQECLACHTPHATANIYLIRPSIDTPNSGTRAVDFRNTTGVAAYSFGTPQASGNGVNMCETCHTRTKNADGTPRARNNAPTDWSKHFNGDCRDCHKHAAGFAGGGESGGDDDCLGCHKFGMAVADSGRTSTYHHVIEVGNNRVAGVTSYPTSATPTASTGDLDKSCTQCHSDHNVFRPDINTSNTLGRGANLRTRIANGPPTGNPPAPSAPGDTSPGYYSNRDHDPAFAAGGICLSCHLSAQTKNVVDQKTYANDPGQTAAVVSAIANFGNSSHGYTSVGGQITSGNSAFQVPCSKCHSDSGTSYQNGSSRFQLHTSANRRLLNPLGISAPADPLEENFCFRCHSKSSDTTPGGGAAKGNANRDYYNQVAMSDQSERLFSVFTNTGSYPWDHPVQGTGGLHDPVEGSSADDGTIGGAQRHVQCEDCHNPHAAAPIASGAYAGAVSAYTTAAAPTPDTLSDTGTGKAWTVNGLKGFTVKMVTGAQAGKYSPIYANTANTLSVDFAAAPAVNDKYVIVNWGVTSTNAAWAGNTASPAMRDTWGLNPTWPAALTPPSWDDSAGTATAAEIGAQYATITTWARTPNATLQGQICVKCHSAYAYGASPPNTPSGAGSSSATGWVNTAGAATAQSDIASQFNPNNLSHHAVFARGRNQPIRSGQASYYNTNWPKFVGNGSTISVSTSGTTVTLTGSTWPVTLLPGWFISVGSAAPAQGATSWYEIVSVTSTTALTVDRAAGTLTGQNFMLTAGLGNNFVPPYGPWSTLSCSDCHSSSVASDPYGPHGSAIKWLLRGGEPQNFLFYNGTASTPTSVAAVSYTPDSYNMCLNCHRRDVYGDYNVTAPALNLYPRQEHPVDKGKNHSLQYRSNWGIPCMNCHGGARIGQIHGSNLGIGNGGATAASYSGRRLLAGSSWYAVTRSGTAAGGACWTKGATDSVDNCGHTHSGVGFLSGATAGRATYDYESGAQ